MARYQLICPVYHGKDNNFVLYARDENGKKRAITVNGFQPYFYLPETTAVGNSSWHAGTEFGFKSLFGTQMQRVITHTPDQVGKWRESFPGVHHEGDIKYERRLLLDSGIYSGFECPDHDTVFWEDLRPVNTAYEKISVTWDIEVLTPRRLPDAENPIYPVIGVSLHDTVSDKYVSIVLDDYDKTEWWAPDHLVIHVSTERRLFELVCEYLERVAGDVLRNWNVFFDNDYFLARAYRAFGSEFGNYVRLVFEKYADFDQLEGYRRIFHKASNQLKDVVVQEGLASEEDVIHEGFRLYKTNKELFIRYSKNDVMYCVQIDRKHRLTEFYWGYKTFTGLETFAPAMAHGTSVDCLMLRDGHENHLVLPSRHSYEESLNDDSYEGAIVFEPKPGIPKGVGIFDMSKYYPSIILAWHLSPENKQPDGTYKGEGIYQRVVRKLMTKRAEFDDAYDEALREFGPKAPATLSIKEQRQAAKDTLNSVYGYAGWSGSRLYDPEMAATITRVAREGLEFIKKTVESMGFVVLYGDTDSVMLQVPLEKCRELEAKINDGLREFCLSQGADPLLKIKWEKYARQAVFVEVSSGERGAKKRYAYRCILEDDKEVDYTVVRGFDRRDSSKIGRETRLKVIDMILYDQTDQIQEYVRGQVRGIKEGRWSYDDITPGTGFNMDPDKYEVKTDYVRGALFSNNFLDMDIAGGDFCRVLPVKKIPGKPPTDVMCYLNSSQIPPGTIVNVAEIIRKTLMIKLETILRACNVSWEELMTTRTLGKAFDSVAIATSEQKRTEICPNCGGKGILLDESKIFPVEVVCNVCHGLKVVVAVK